MFEILLDHINQQQLRFDCKKKLTFKRSEKHPMVWNQVGSIRDLIVTVLDQDEVYRNSCSGFTQMYSIISLRKFKDIHQLETNAHWRAYCNGALHIPTNRFVHLDTIVESLLSGSKEFDIAVGSSVKLNYGEPSTV